MPKFDQIESYSVDDLGDKMLAFIKTVKNFYNNWNMFTVEQRKELIQDMKNELDTLVQLISLKLHSASQYSSLNIINLIENNEFQQSVTRVDFLLPELITQYKPSGLSNERIKIDIDRNIINFGMLNLSQKKDNLNQNTDFTKIYFDHIVNNNNNNNVSLLTSKDVFFKKDNTSSNSELEVLDRSLDKK